MVKKTLLSLAIAATAAGMTGCNISSVQGNNKVDETAIKTGDPALGGKAADTVSPIFSPATSKLPLANDLIFAVNSGEGVVAGVTPGADGTADLDNREKNPVKTAINDLDGFSTVAPIDIPLNGLLSESSLGNTSGGVLLIPLKNASHSPTVGITPIDPLNIQTIVDVAGLKKASAEKNLAGAAAIIGNAINQTPVDQPQFEVTQVVLKTPTGQSVPHLRILLQKPLLPKTKYVIALTTELKSANGKALTEPTEYTSLTGTGSLFSSRLAPVRDLVTLTENIAGGVLSKSNSSKGAKDIVLSYSFTTGGTTDVLKAMAAPETFIVGASISEAEVKVRKAATDKQIAAGDSATVAAAKAEGALKQIAAGVATAVSAHPSIDIDATADNVIALVKANETAAAAYKNALRKQITDGLGAQTLAGLNALVDSPKSRTYTAIPHPQLANTAISASTTDVLKKALEPVIRAAIEKQVRDNLPDGTSEEAAKTAVDNAITANLANQLNAKVGSIDSQGKYFQGGLTTPSYLPDAEVGKADSELGMWRASDAVSKALRKGLAAPQDKDKTTNVSYRFPFAAKVGEGAAGYATLPVLATMPSATCDPDGAGPTPAGKPAAGWPTVIYQHGITVDRTAGLLVGNTLASKCIATVAIDHAMHGVAPLDGTKANSRLLFNVEQRTSSILTSPFATARAAAVQANAASPLANLKERHNNVGKGSAAADKAKPGVAMVFNGLLNADNQAVTAPSVGASGDLYINLQNFGRTRDAIRQTVVDLLNLNASIDAMDVDGNGTADDLNPDKVYFIGHSLGGIVGSTFLAVNNDTDVNKYNTNIKPIKAAVLGNPGGGVVKLLENSPRIGSSILAGLAAKNLSQGDASLETFFTVFQATVDSADPINFVATQTSLPLAIYEDVGTTGSTTEVPDQVVPNNTLNPAKPSAKSLLSGTDPLVKMFGIDIAENAAQKVDQTAVQNALDNNMTPAALQQPNTGMIETTTGPVRVNVRVAQGTHSTFSSGQPEAVFAETYLQAVSFFDAYGLIRAVRGKSADHQVMIVKDKTVLEAPAQ